jgi:hypothetical protein
LVVFRRTGGIRTDPETQTDTINPAGRVPIRMAALDSGDVTVNIEVRLGEPFGTEIIPGVRLSSRNSDDQIFLGLHTVGRWFPQFGIVRAADTDQPIAGARITFRRTSGISFQPDPYSSTTNPDGSFPLRPQPLSDGEVVGDLTITPPSPYRETVIPGVRLQTSMSDALQLVGLFRVTR